MYRVIRYYRDRWPNQRTIACGLTLEEAQAHCNDPETSSSTATGKVARARTRRVGAWFDGYRSEACGRLYARPEAISMAVDRSSDPDDA
jgi:hypothetical protein